MDTPILLGRTVRLDALRPDDALTMVEIADGEVDRWVRWASKSPLTEAEALADIEAAINSWHGGLSRMHWAIRLRDDPTLIGRADLQASPNVQIRWASIWLGPKHRNVGIATEAMRVLLDHAFGALDWPWVEAQIDAENARSIRLAERLGGRFEREGPRHGDGRLIRIFRFVRTR